MYWNYSKRRFTNSNWSTNNENENEKKNKSKKQTNDDCDQTTNQTNEISKKKFQFIVIISLFNSS